MNASLAARHALRRTLAALLLAAALVATALALSPRPAGAATAESSRTPRCFGAASMDPRNPCRNTALERRVTPSPRRAAREGAYPCREVLRAEGTICAFGRSAARARRIVALVGDSHARHWADAFAHVARRKGWRVLVVYRTKCPLNAQRKRSPNPDRANCVAWNKRVTRYLNARPRIDTVFVSQRFNVPYYVPRGQRLREVSIRGYVRAWQRLRDRTQVVALRDVPYSRPSTNRCVERSLRRNRRPGRDCAIPRRESLSSDPVMEAVERAGAPRAQGIDLSDFMCEARVCRPVIGGVLVRKDLGHLTRTFSRTLGPYLLRHVDRLDLR